jgi:hypothetical protein
MVMSKRILNVFFSISALFPVSLAYMVYNTMQVICLKTLAAAFMFTFILTLWKVLDLTLLFDDTATAYHLKKASHSLSV